MIQNSIGQFIAALRKADGMTQQEVADRLGVSNKAVSRWERDECAPDLTLIPALAELFGVTCDELLKGARIPISSGETGEKKEPKVEKQVKALLSRTLTQFKTLIWIALAVALAGPVTCFGIAYGLAHFILGCAVGSLFEIAALVLAAVAVTRVRSIKEDNELFESAPPALVKKFDHETASFSFAAFFIPPAVVLLPLPVLFMYYVGGTIPEAFFAQLLLSVWAWLILRPRWIARQTRETLPPRAPVSPCRKKMDLLQLGLFAAATLVCLFSTFLQTKSAQVDLSVAVVMIGGLVLLLAGIVCLPIFCVRHPEERKGLLLSGIRNLCLIPAAYWLVSAHQVTWVGTNWSPVRRDIWYWGYVWDALLWIAAVFLLGSIIRIILQKKKR